MDGGRDISWITMGMHQPMETIRTGLQPARPQTARKFGAGSGGGLDAGGSRPGSVRLQRPMSARPAISVADSSPWGASGSGGKSVVVNPNSAGLRRASTRDELAGQMIPEACASSAVFQSSASLKTHLANKIPATEHGGGGPSFTSLQSFSKQDPASKVISSRSLLPVGMEGEPCRQSDHDHSRWDGQQSITSQVAPRLYSKLPPTSKGERSMIREMSSVAKQLEDAKQKILALEERRQMWQARSTSLEEIVKTKEDENMMLDSENQKLLYLIGMREGEIARLYREIDHIKEIRSLEGRQMYENPPGTLPRPSSPFVNEIDENAKNLRKELYDADEDLERRIKLSEKMHTMVSAVSEATKERADAERALKESMKPQHVQTECKLEDFEALIDCANDGSVPADAGEEAFMQNVAKVARTRPNLLGVPLSFHGVVKTSGPWIRIKNERMANLSLEDYRSKIMSIYFSKMFSDKEDDFHRSKRLSLPAFVHEWALLHHGTLKKAELEVLEIVTAARHFKSDRRVHLFARMCHAFGGADEKESPLPLEGLNFGLDVLFYLHETAAQTIKSTTDKSKGKVLSDADFFKAKPHHIADEANLFLDLDNKPSFKKSRVCRIVKHCMMTWCTYDYTDGDFLPSAESNKEFNVDEAMDFAIGVFSHVYIRRKDRLMTKFSICNINAGGAIDSLKVFLDLIRQVDPNRSDHQLIHMFQAATAASATTNSIDAVVFCENMQLHHLDRPHELSKGQDLLCYTPSGSKSTRPSRIQAEQKNISHQRSSGSFMSISAKSHRSVRPTSAKPGKEDFGPSRPTSAKPAHGEVARPTSASVSPAASPGKKGLVGTVGQTRIASPVRELEGALEFPAT